jgi:hypothetical protein
MIQAVRFGNVRVFAAHLSIGKHGDRVNAE